MVESMVMFGPACFALIRSPIALPPTAFRTNPGATSGHLFCHALESRGTEGALLLDADPECLQVFAAD